MTTIEEVLEAKTGETVGCSEICCGPSRQTPEERAAQRERRSVGYERAARLLDIAETAALSGDTEKAKALVEIANAWDSTRY